MANWSFSGQQIEGLFVECIDFYHLDTTMIRHELATHRAALLAMWYGRSGSNIFYTSFIYLHGGMLRGRRKNLKTAILEPFQTRMYDSVFIINQIMFGESWWICAYVYLSEHVCLLCLYIHLCVCVYSYVLLLFHFRSHLYVDWDSVCASVFSLTNCFHCVVLELSLPGCLLHEIPLTEVGENFNRLGKILVCFFCDVLVVNNILPNIL